VVIHALRSLVLGTSLGIDALLSEERLLLFLHETAAWAAPRSEEVHATTPFDSKAGSHISTFHRLDDALEATAGQGAPAAAVTVGHARWRLALETRLSLAEQKTWAEGSQQADVNGGAAVPEAADP